MSGPDYTFTLRQLERGVHIDHEIRTLMKNSAYFMGDRRITGFVFSEYCADSGITYNRLEHDPTLGHGQCIAVIVQHTDATPAN